MCVGCFLELSVARDMLHPAGAWTGALTQPMYRIASAECHACRKFAGGHGEEG